MRSNSDRSNETKSTALSIAVFISSITNTNIPNAKISVSSAPVNSQIAKPPDTTFAQTQLRNEYSDSHVSRRPAQDQITRNFSRSKNSAITCPPFARP